VHEELRRAIIQGKIPHGTRLVESRVAEQMGVSRTPVREALSRLVAQGFVKERDGFRVVADMSVELHEIFSVRKALEGHAAALAAVEATDEELSELEKICNTSLEALYSKSTKKRAALNSEFHYSIARASHNHRLLTLIKECYEYAITEEILPFYDKQDTANHLQQHLDIMRALNNRDPVEAEHAMKHHLASVERVIAQAVECISGGGESPK
jgi:DNA-binding GntR family transcriptional regulator